MPGPQPLHPSVRARTNKASTGATLEIVAPEERAAIEVPELPSDRVWDPKTSDFWCDAWQSPMRLEWDKADTHKILMAAYVLDEFFQLATNPEVRTMDRVYGMTNAAKAFTDLCSKLGLDPYARRSLQWLLVQTEQGEAVTENTRARTAQTRAKTAAGPAKPKPKSSRQKRGLAGLE